LSCAAPRGFEKTSAPAVSIRGEGGFVIRGLFDRESAEGRAAKHSRFSAFPRSFYWFGFI
jgi:hypothetical protein